MAITFVRAPGRMIRAGPGPRKIEEGRIMEERVPSLPDTGLVLGAGGADLVLLLRRGSRLLLATDFRIAPAHAA